MVRQKGPLGWNDESRNAGYIDKTEPERKSFATSPYLKVFPGHRLRFGFPRPPGWNDEGGDFEQDQQDRAENKSPLGWNDEGGEFG